MFKKTSLQGLRVPMIFEVSLQEFPTHKRTVDFIKEIWYELSTFWLVLALPSIPKIPMAILGQFLSNPYNFQPGHDADW